MYDEGFNLNGLMDNAVAAPYGEHGMDRGDTNNPAAYRGNVTAADPYPVRGGDVQVGRPEVTYTYGRHYGAAYGDVDVEMFYDPNDANYLYSYTPSTRQIVIVKSPRSRGGIVVAPGTDAYKKILAIYQGQAKTGQTTKTTGKPGQILATVLGALAAGLTAPVAPAAVPAAAAPAAAPAVPGAPAGSTTTTQNTGVPMWVWAAGLAAVGITVFAFMGNKGAKS